MSPAWTIRLQEHISIVIVHECKWRIYVCGVIEVELGRAFTTRSVHVEEGLTLYDNSTRVFSNLKTLSHDLELDSIPEIYAKLLKGDCPRSESMNDTGVAQKTRRK
jgi:hypothetical protein